MRRCCCDELVYCLQIDRQSITYFLFSLPLPDFVLFWLELCAQAEVSVITLKVRVYVDSNDCPFPHPIVRYLTRDSAKRAHITAGGSHPRLRFLSTAALLSIYPLTFEGIVTATMPCHKALESIAYCAWPTKSVGPGSPSIVTIQRERPHGRGM